MAVRAKFYVAELTSYAHNAGQAHVTLRPVVRGEENKGWAAATPSGEVKLNVGNPVASDWFRERLGKELFITFTDSE